MLSPIRVVPFVIALLLIALGNFNAVAQTEGPGVIYESGFSNVEHFKDTSWRWMDEEGVVKLKNARKDMVLKFAGRPPVNVMLPEPPIMKIFLNGEELEQFTPSTKIFEKEFKLSAAKLGDGLCSELKITTTKVFVPSKFDKKSTDDRHLGFKLYTLTWLTADGALLEPVHAPGPDVRDQAPPGSKGWLAALLLLILVVSLLSAAAVGIWLYLRQRPDSV
jgi:hypothetical protein